MNGSGAVNVLAALAAVVATAAAGAALAQEAAPAPASIIEGTWQTRSKSEITIVPCGAGFCGRITRIVVPQEYIDKYGTELAQLNGNYFDYNNKDPALRNRPIQDMQILQMRPGRDPWVFDGEIYNPEDGNVYSGYIQVIDGDHIRLNGCVLYNTICQGEDWVRIPTPVPVAPIPAEAALRPQ